MGIVIRFILKNIYEKKLRTFLLVFSILISSSLFFSSLAISDNVVDIFLSDARQYYGTSDLIIHQNENSPSPFLQIKNADFYAPNIDYIIGVVQGSAYYKYKRNETVTINLRGTTIQDIGTMSNFITETAIEPDSFIGNNIILSTKAAEKYGFKKGDTIDLEINKMYRKFKVFAIAQPTGFFSENGQSLNAIIPKSTLASIYGRQDADTFLFVKLKEGVNLKQSIKVLGDAYKRYTVEEPVSEEQMKQDTGSISTGFMMMTVVVLFMSVFIIYTSFKVITMERLPVIGTFRSVGATRRTTDLVLLAESAMYGIIGGLLGCVSGIGILFIITKAITPSYMAGFDTKLVYTGGQLAAAFILAVVLSLVSSILPIIKISKIPVKDIVLNSIEKVGRKKQWKYILGVAALVSSFVIPPLSPKSIALVLDTVSMMLSVVGVILLIPLLTAGFVKLFENIYTAIFGNVGVLAAKNLRENKSILNNISLLAIGISSLIMITSVSDSVLKEVSSFFTRSAKYEVWMFVNGDRSFEQSLLAVDGVEQVYGNFEYYGAEVSGRNARLSLLQGVNSSKFLDFMSVDMEGDKQALLYDLDKGRNIIITNSLKEKFGLKVGDSISFHIRNKDVTYKIIGLFNSIMDGGDYALISDKYFKIDTGARNYNNIYIKTNKSPDEVVSKIREKYSRMQPYLLTMSELEKNNYETNAQVFNAMKAFAIMTLVIGIFGVINNYIISFLERKRSLAMYRSVGMSKSQIVKMMFIESLSGGVVGGSLGVAAGWLMTQAVPYVMKAMDQPIPLYINPATLILSFAAGCIITIVASISPIRKSSRLKLIEALKYE